MAKKIIYYTCEMNGKKHDFKQYNYIVDGVEYRNLQVCKRCGSVYNFGGINIANTSLGGIDLKQYLMKELTEMSQNAIFLKKQIKASKSTPESERWWKEILETVDEKVESTATPWRMN